MSVIEYLEEKTGICVYCNKEAAIQSFILKDSKPFKLYTSVICSSCKMTDVAECDYESLDYGVNITLTFEKDAFLLDKRRIAFINAKNNIRFFNKDGKEMISLSVEICNIEALENTIFRIEEMLSFGEKKEVEGLKEFFDKVNLGEPFKLVIEDKSGYSKVCPLGVEYTEIMDMTPEQMNKLDSHIMYEITKK